MTLPASWGTTNFGPPSTAGAVIGPGALLDFNEHGRAADEPQRVDFEKVNAIALSNIESVLNHYLPGGTIRGREYVCGSISGGQGESCSTNINTGVGSEFAGGINWGDPVDLVAKVRGLRMIEAAQELSEFLNIQPGTPTPKIERQSSVEKYELGKRDALAKWSEATECPPDYPYILAKGLYNLSSKEIRLHEPTGDLLVLLSDEHGKPWSVQRISPNGEKKINHNGKMSGNFLVIDGDPNAVYICEGYATAKTVALTTGHVAVAAISTSNLVPVGEKIAKLYPDAQLVFAADNDNVTPKLPNQVKNPGITLAEKAVKEIGRGTVIAPPAQPETKVDWNDYALKHGLDAVRQQLRVVIQGAGSAVGKEETREQQARVATPWPQPIDLKQLSQKQPAPPTFIMKDWLPCGYATLFAGHGGIGKSGLALVLAVCMAMGLLFFGLPVERRRVMYLSCEDREGVLHWRLIKICNFLGIALEDLAGWLTVLDLVGHETILYQPNRNGSPLTAAYHQLAERMKLCETEVLMVDGISDTYDGNENARAEVKAYVNATLALIPPERGAVILIGHVAKPMNGHKTTEGYSGSTGWHNSVRARWYLYPEAKRANEEGLAERTGDLLLELQKSNLGPTDGCLRFAWDDNAGMFTGAVDQAESNFDRNYRDRTEQEAILAVLRASAVPVPAAASGQRTAFHVLSAQNNFPESLRAGNPERKRFWRHIERLRAIGEIVEECITRSDRHKVRVLVAQNQSTSACGHAGNAGTEHSPHNGRTPLCGHAGNAAGGYKGGPAPATDNLPEWGRP